MSGKILDGIERDRSLVVTSADIRLAFLAQRWCQPVYELATRRLNSRLAATAAQAAARSAA